MLVECYSPLEGGVRRTFRLKGLYSAVESPQVRCFCGHKTALCRDALKTLHGLTGVSPGRPGHLQVLYACSISSTSRISSTLDFCWSLFTLSMSAPHRIENCSCSSLFIAFQHAYHRERDIVLAFLSVRLCLSVCPSSAGIASKRIHQWHSIQRDGKLLIFYWLPVYSMDRGATRRQISDTKRAISKQ